jgi:TolA-binding protein
MPRPPQATTPHWQMSSNTALASPLSAAASLMGNSNTVRERLISVNSISTSKFSTLKPSSTLNTQSCSPPSKTGRGRRAPIRLTCDPASHRNLSDDDNDEDEHDSRFDAGNDDSSTTDDDEDNRYRSGNNKDRHRERSSNGESAPQLVIADLSSKLSSANANIQSLEAELSAANLKLEEARKNAGASSAVTPRLNEVTLANVSLHDADTDDADHSHTGNTPLAPETDHYESLLDKVLNRLIVLTDEKEYYQQELDDALDEIEDLEDEIEDLRNKLNRMASKTPQNRVKFQDLKGIYGQLLVLWFAVSVAVIIQTMLWRGLRSSYNSKFRS